MYVREKNKIVLPHTTQKQQMPLNIAKVQISKKVTLG
jgi:hypothetical protein